jgi:hypothetical protein
MQFLLSHLQEECFRIARLRVIADSSLLSLLLIPNKVSSHQFFKTIKILKSKKYLTCTKTVVVTFFGDIKLIFLATMTTHIIVL